MGQGGRLGALIAVFGLLPTLALADVVRVEAVRSPGQAQDPAVLDSLIGIDATGAEVWRRRVTPYRDVIGPIVVGGHTVYGHMNDLIEIDQETGRVLARDRFPARIRELVPAADLEPIVTVTIDPGAQMVRRATEGGTLAVRHHLGDPAPGKAMLTDMFGWYFVSSVPDELRAPNRYRGDRAPVAERAKAEHAVAALEPMLAMDPTDVSLRYDLGLWLLALEREAEADAMFRSAAQADAPWPDLLFLWGLLEQRGLSGPAAIAYERGKAGMDRAGVRPEAMQGLVAWMILGGGRAAYPVRDAIAAGDVARVEELASRSWALAPLVEGGDQAWHVLARWFAAHDRPDLAATWHARAEAAQGGWFNRLRRDFIHSTRRLPPVLDGMLLGLIGGAALVGVRAATRRRAVGGRRYAPVLGWHDVLLVMAPLIVVGVLVTRIARHEASFANAFRTPLLFDAYAAPSLIVDLEHARPSAAVDRVLAYARAEQRALTDGVGHTTPPPGEGDVAKAMARLDTMASSSTLALAGRGAGPIARWIHDVGAIAALGLLGAFALAFALATRFPAAGRAFETIVPGAGPTFASGSALLMGLFATGLLVCLQADPLAEIPGSFLRYFGLDRLSEPGIAPASRDWAWLLVAAVPALHVLERLRPRRREG